MFEITGIRDGKKYSVCYKNDKLTGDHYILQIAVIENEKDHGLLGLVPSIIESNYLAYELPAACLLQKYVFDTVISLEHNWYTQNESPDVIY